MLARVSLAWMVAACWALFAGLAVWLTLRGGGIALDTDAAMRLSEVRDLLAGQAWFDTAQHRMNTPYGLSMHWSRLADIGPAALILVLRPLLGQVQAESVMLYAWPLLTLAAVLAGLARIAGHLGGRKAALLVLPLALLCTQTYGLFAPGDIDHHNLQLALTLWALAFLIERRAAAAATATALSLCIGLETLPYAIVSILAACLWLKADPALARRFGLVLASASAVLLLAIVARQYRFAPACDTFSLFYAGLLAAGGLGLGLIAAMPRHRLWGFVLLCAVVLLLAAAMNPACLAGPYAGVGPHLERIFLGRINEARPVWRFISFAPSEFVAGWCYGAFGLLASLALPRGPARNLLLGFSAAAMATASFQIREANFAVILALSPIAALLARFVLPRSLAAAVLGLLLTNDAAFALAGGAIEGDRAQAARIRAFDAQVECGEAASLSVLRALPPGRVAGFVDQGPAILAYTPDAAIAGPYHRDGAGIEDTYAVFTGAPPAAHAILRRRGIVYLMACRAAPDWKFYIAEDPHGLLARLAKGQTPDWLAFAGRAGNVEVWRLR